jgi:hypothetical protein
MRHGAVFTIDARIAQLSAPPSLPLNNELRLPIAIGRIERSTVLLATSTRPSRRNSVKPVPVMERIVDGLRQLRLGEELVDYLDQSRLERRHQRPGAAGGSRCSALLPRISASMA